MKNSEDKFRVMVDTIPALVWCTLPDGSTVFEQIPLTLEDALHPQEGDKIMTNTVHDRDWTYLGIVARRLVAGDATAIEFFLQAIAGKPRNDHRDVVFAAALVCLINQLPHSAFQIRSAVYGFDHLLRFDFIR